MDHRLTDSKPEPGGYSRQITGGKKDEKLSGILHNQAKQA
jgi:hypothetical protein